MVKRGIFFMVSGPAGVGKTTLLARLVAEEKGLVKAISVTTRAARKGEADGVAYHFWSNEKFDEAVSGGKFLEHAVVHGNRYGTLVSALEEQLKAGLDVVKDIDVQGVQQIRQQERFLYPATVGIFVMPPTPEHLHKRLAARASESPEALARRLKAAEEEMARAKEFEYVVVNDSVDESVAKLKAIRTTEHCRRA